MELFFCQPTNTSLTREGCGRNWSKAKELKAEGAKDTSAALSTLRNCIGCPLGEAHVNGEQPDAWPDGRPLNLRTVNLRPFATEPPKKPETKKVSLPVAVPIPEKPKKSSPAPAPILSYGHDKKMPETSGSVSLYVAHDPVTSEPLVTSGATPEEAKQKMDAVPHVVIEKKAEPKKLKREVGRAERKPPTGRPPAKYVFKGVSKTAVDWAKEQFVKDLGLTPALIRMRRNKGWDDDKIFTTKNVVAQGATYPVELDLDGLKPEIAHAVNSIIKEFRLTNRTSDALIAIAKGMDRDSFGVLLGMKYATVKTTYGRLFSALGRHSEAEVMRLIVERTPSSESQMETKVDTTGGPVSVSVPPGTRLIAESSVLAPVVEDPEIAAMSALANAMTPLGPDARRRVLSWASSRYGK
jgi:hypothetical protein